MAVERFGEHFIAMIESKDNLDTCEFLKLLSGKLLPEGKSLQNILGVFLAFPDLHSLLLVSICWLYTASLIIIVFPFNLKENFKKLG